MNTIEYATRIEQDISQLIHHSVSLERDNAHLKRIIRLIAKSLEKDVEGNQMGMTSQEAEFVRKMTEELNIFNNGYGDIEGELE